MVPDIRSFLGTVDHKEDLDSITLKVISHINDKDARFEPNDNQIEIPVYSSFSNTSKSDSSSSSSSSWSSSSSPNRKRKKFSMERSETPHEANSKLGVQGDKVASVSQVPNDQSRDTDLGNQGVKLYGI